MGDSETDEEPLFYETKKSLRYLNAYWKSMRCPTNLNDLYTYGNYDSNR